MGLVESSLNWHIPLKWLALQKPYFPKYLFNILEDSLLEEKAELGGIQRKIISLRKSDCTIAK